MAWVLYVYSDLIPTYVFRPSNCIVSLSQLQPGFAEKTTAAEAADTGRLAPLPLQVQYVDMQV